MTLLNRYFRSVILIFLLITTSIFALKAYGHTLDGTPPLSFHYWSASASKEMVVDVNRQIFFTTQALRSEVFSFPSPDNTYLANSRYEGGETIISVAPIGDTLQELGRYPSVNLGSFAIYWSADSTGLYLLRQNVQDETLDILFIDRETGAEETQMSIETDIVPNRLTLINEDVLRINGTETLYVNLATQQINLIPVQERNILNPFTRSNRVVYSDTIAPNDLDLLDALQVFDIETWETSTIDLRDLPDTVTYVNTFSIPWINDDTEFAVSLEGGGVAFINIVTGGITYLDTEMVLHVSSRTEDNWLVGRINNEAGDVTLVAHFVPIGEEIPLMTARASTIAQINVEQSPFGEVLLLSRSNRQANPTLPYNTFIKMIQLPSGEVLYDGIITGRERTEPYPTFSYQWYFLRYGDAEAQ